MRAKGWLVASSILLAGTANADEADILDVSIRISDNSAAFSVTLRHADTGWEDYADGWRVELFDGTILGTRVLLHPHVSEQPFTRSLIGVALPEGVTVVYVRAKTLT